METHSEDTLFKVLSALKGEADVDGTWIPCLDAQQAQDAIRRMQNAGILFREMETAEQASKRIIEEVTTQQTEVEYEFMQPLSKDEVVRLECLQMATQTIPLNRTGNEGQFIERARFFEQYVRSGAFEETKNG